MHPAPSLILFTTLSGLGFGLLAFLGLGVIEPVGLRAFLWFATGYGLATLGLAVSAFHLGRPERALRAFSQWRSSWLSREAVLSVGALLFLAPHALALIVWNRPLIGFGAIGGLLALQTVLATSMIYAQLRTVPRWHHWTTPAVFLLAAITGGALLSGMPALSHMLLAWLAVALMLHWILGDNRLAATGSTLGTATGLGERGSLRALEPPHTGTNYLLREMVHVVGRGHATKLRVIALMLGCILPSVLIWAAPASMAVWLLAVLSHLLGMLVGRWLFFAQAEHVVGLYYGAR
ncbi:MAG: dimethyl sulfoxide reductase anchor subunit [Pararhodobacter sp.]